MVVYVFTVNIQHARSLVIFFKQDNLLDLVNEAIRTNNAEFYRM
jgi:hypothetical protein